MKPRLTFLMLAAGVLAMSPARLTAQDTKPAPQRAQEPARPVVPPDRLDGDRSRRERGIDHRGPGEAESVPTPFIGVVTRELEPEVRAQTGLPDGHGLLVVEIMPDGPAKEAGLQQHDLLVQYEDQKLVNIDQLQVLVRNQKKGDEVVLTVLRAGAEQKVKVKIGERNMPRIPDHPRDRPFSFPLPRGGSFRYEPPPGQDQNVENWRERVEKFQNEMREYQRRIQEWSSGSRDHPMPQPPQLDVPQPPRRDGEFRKPPQPGADNRRADNVPSSKSEQRVESSVRVETKNGDESHVVMHGNVIRTDDTGVYTIHRENGRTTFTVRTKDGRETSWPVNNDQERQAVPEQYRDVLRQMDNIQLKGGDAGGRRRELQEAPAPKSGGQQR